MVSAMCSVQTNPVHPNAWVSIKQKPWLLYSGKSHFRELSRKSSPPHPTPPLFAASEPDWPPSLGRALDTVQILNVNLNIGLVLYASAVNMCVRGD